MKKGGWNLSKLRRSFAFSFAEALASAVKINSRTIRNANTYCNVRYPRLQCNFGRMQHRWRRNTQHHLVHSDFTLSTSTYLLPFRAQRFFETFLPASLRTNVFLINFCAWPMFLQRRVFSRTTLRWQIDVGVFFFFFRWRRLRFSAFLTIFL